MAIGRKNHRVVRSFDTWTQENARHVSEIDMPAIIWSNGFPLVFFWKDRGDVERTQYERWTR